MLKICNNFIVFDPELDTFRFAYLSVREYLEQRPEYSTTMTNALAAEACLWAILSAGLLKLGWRADAPPATLEQLCTYADIYWPGHCKSAEDRRRFGKLETMLRHLLLGFRGSNPTIILWNNRLQNHLAGYKYWDVRMPLEDTFPRVGSEMCIGLFVSCAFDFAELIGAGVEGSAGSMDCVNRENRSLLHIATRNGSCASLARLFMLNKPRLEITQEVVVAAAGNYYGKEVMALLLDRRGDEVQITQEVIVAAAGNDDGGRVVEYLHERTPIDITDNVIRSAATSGQESTLCLFDQWAEDSIVAKNWFDIAHLCAAAKEGNTKTVLELTERGVPPDKQDNLGRTPLWHAAANGHAATVRALLATNEVDINATSVSKRTPLFWPAAHGYVEVVKLLLNYGSQQDYEDKDGRYPLTIARIYGQTRVVEIFEAKNV